MFRLSNAPLDPAALRRELPDGGAGACVSFEGRVRGTNDGRRVERLDYEAYGPLAEREGARIVEEARAKFPILAALCVHRTGPLEVGELAVWAGVCAEHREAAFAAGRFLIDEVKARVPIWKKEHYAGGAPRWIAAEPGQ